MSRHYGVTWQDGDTLRVTSADATGSEPKLIGLLRRISNRVGGTIGWRLDARVVLRSPSRKVWLTPEDPLVATGLMTRREAKAAVAAASTATAAGRAQNRPDRGRILDGPIHMTSYSDAQR